MEDVNEVDGDCEDKYPRNSLLWLEKLKKLHGDVSESPELIFEKPIRHRRKLQKANSKNDRTTKKRFRVAEKDRKRSQGHLLRKSMHINK